MSRRRKTEPFVLRIDRLGRKGLGIGVHEGREVGVRFAPPGAVLEVRPAGRRRKLQLGKRLRLISAPQGAVAPRCAVFTLCGGCGLQELDLARQRHHKQARVHELLAPLEGVCLHEVRGVDEAYGYRNKIELSYGVRCFLSPADHEAGASIAGRFLGFHAPERFDRIVDTARCELVSEGLNAALAGARSQLAGSSLEPWDVRAHTGFWRHLVLRETTTGERLAAVYTSEPAGPAAEREVRALAEAMPGLTGVVWHVNPGTSDAAVGARRAVVTGRPWIEERLGPLTFRLSPTSFFQTNTRAAEVLYDCVAEAAGTGTRLLDLYCGTGTISLWLAPRFGEVVGVELNPEAVADARENAARNGVQGLRFEAGGVEEVALALEADTVVVDPPRAGLHPRAARWLSELGTARRLVYVACQPASLARDRVVLEAGGWKLTELWTVDLFPQTGHSEAVVRFER